MTDPSGPRRVTVAVIHHHIKGYAEDCLRSLGAATPRADTEFLLVAGEGFEQERRVLDRFPGVRVVRVERGDRAAAKNLAVAEAHGEFVLLVSADMLACPGAVERLWRFLESQFDPLVASAQLLMENGLPRCTAYRFPSLLRKANPLGWVVPRLRKYVPKRRQLPHTGSGAGAECLASVKAEALTASFLMARRETFRAVGEFTEGYRFGYEDTEWCRRAVAKRIARVVVTDALAYKLSPQLHGELPPHACIAMTASLIRLVEATRGKAYSALFRGLLKTESFCKWAAAGLVNRLVCGRSPLFRNDQVIHKAIWTMPREGPPDLDLPPDIESDVRWEYVV